MKMEIHGVSGEVLAKRMLKLAWDAAGVVGAGFLQDRGQQSEESLWKRRCDNYYANGNTSGRVESDYLFGRMMKLAFAFTATTIEGADVEWRSDYQSFCRKFPNLKSLVIEAARTLGATVTESAPQAA